MFLIMAHELGHFTFAKINKIKVNEFSIGFGPKLFSIKGKETTYLFKPLLLGGYCAMEGEDETSENPNAFCNKKPWQRFFVLLMGAGFNIILGFIIVAVMLSPGNAFVTTTVKSFSENATSNTAIKNDKTESFEKAENSESENCLKENDKIIEVNGRKVNTAMELSYTFTNVKNGNIDMTVLRDGKKTNLKGIRFNTVNQSGYNIISVDFNLKAQKKTVVSYIEQTFKITGSYAKIVWWSLIDMIGGKYKISDVSGPVGVTAAMGDAARQNVLNLLPFMALLTINLGIVNLLPLPALDGGRILFVIFEMIFKKPVPAKYENIVHTVGFVILFALLILVMGKDIWQLISKAF